MSRHLHRNEHGQTLVEFALIVPIFILVLMGIFDLGRAVYAYNTISNASREGIRVAIVDQSAAAIRDEVVSQTPGLGVAPADVDVTFRMPGSAAVCVSPIAIACEIEVVVNYDYQAATPLIGNIVGTISMASTSRAPVERSYESP